MPPVLFPLSSPSRITRGEKKKAYLHDAVQEEWLEFDIDVGPVGSLELVEEQHAKVAVRGNDVIVTGDAVSGCHCE